jgi:RNA polymerase sigma-70 factor, ECF subfamily
MIAEPTAIQIHLQLKPTAVQRHVWQSVCCNLGQAHVQIADRPYSRWYPQQVLGPICSIFTQKARQLMKTNYRADAAVSDAELLTRVRTGEMGALQELHDRYFPRAYALVLRMLGEPVLAEECVAAAFMQLGASPQSTDPRMVFVDQLLSLVHGLAARHLQAMPELRAARSSRYLSHAQLPAGATGPARMRASAAANEMDEKQAAALIALAHLDQSERAVLELAYFCCMSRQEIAACLQQSTESVNSTLRRGMLKLQAALVARASATP